MDQVLCIFAIIAMASAYVGEIKQPQQLYHYPKPVQYYQSQPYPKLVSYSNENTGNGNYQFGYETSDGTSRQEQGYLDYNARSQTGEPGLNVRGSYAFRTPDNRLFRVNYVADSNGFQPGHWSFPTPEDDGGYQYPQVEDARLRKPLTTLYAPPQ